MELSDSMATLSLAGSAGQPAAAPPASPTAAAAAPKPAAPAQPKPAGLKRAAAAKPATAPKPPAASLLDSVVSPLPAERAAKVAAQYAQAVAAGKHQLAMRYFLQYIGEREGAGSEWAEKPGAAEAMGPGTKLSDLAVVNRRAALREAAANKQEADNTRDGEEKKRLAGSKKTPYSPGTFGGKSARFAKDGYKAGSRLFQ